MCDFEQLEFTEKKVENVLVPDANSFGCCDKYMSCSDMQKCIHADTEKASLVSIKNH